MPKSVKNGKREVAINCEKNQLHFVLCYEYSYNVVAINQSRKRTRYGDKCKGVLSVTTFI